MPNYTATVVGSRIRQAVQTVINGDAWIGIGKTSPWPGDGSPPQVDPETMVLTEMVAFKKAETITLVVPDPDGAIEHLRQRWMPVTVGEARNKKSRWVYIATWLRYDEVPIVDYRQTGAFIAPVRKTEVAPGKSVLLSSEIEDIGYLIAVSNRSPIPRAEDQKELVEFIVEF